MSDAEKLVEAGIKYPDDPLILRPQVGGDFRSRPYNGFCWPRSLILRLMLIGVMLATIAGCILIIFTLRHSNVWPWHSYAHHIGSTAGFCRALMPFPGLGVEERYFYEPNAITITHGPIVGFPAVSIFHLLNDAMTVMRTQDTCYVYPLTPEVAEAVPVDETVVERIKNTLEPGMVQFKSPLAMRMFMVSPRSEDRIRINHPAAAANCSGVGMVRLVEMVLSQDSNQPDSNSEAPVSPGICSKECPPGENRDSLGIPHQVCRCPPKTPITNFATTGEQEIVKEEKESYFFGGFNSRFVDDDVKSESHELSRRQRAAEALHKLEPPMKVPSDCHVVDKILEGAVPTGNKRTLSLFTIVQR